MLRMAQEDSYLCVCSVGWWWWWWWWRGCRMERFCSFLHAVSLQTLRLISIFKADEFEHCKGNFFLYHAVLSLLSFSLSSSLASWVIPFSLLWTLSPTSSLCSSLCPSLLRPPLISHSLFWSLLTLQFSTYSIFFFYFHFHPSYFSLYSSSPVDSPSLPDSLRLTWADPVKHQTIQKKTQNCLCSWKI